MEDHQLPSEVCTNSLFRDAAIAVLAGIATTAIATPKFAVYSAQTGKDHAEALPLFLRQLGNSINHAADLATSVAPAKVRIAKDGRSVDLI